MDPKSDKDPDDDDIFAKLETDFQAVLDELLGDEALDKFRKEYEKLHGCLKKSHDSEKRLMAKCRELNAEIVSNTAKIASALKLSQDDKSTISKLKNELDAAWKMVDTAHDKETRARETIGALKTEINELSKLVERGAGLSVGQESSVNQLIADRDALKAQLDQATSELTSLREKQTQVSTELENVAKEREGADEKVSELQQDMQMKMNELQREMRKRDKLDREVAALKKETSEKQKQIENIKKRLVDQEDCNNGLSEQYKQTQVQLERTKKEADILNSRLTKTQQDYENQVEQSDRLAAENQKKLAELKAREDEIQAMKAEALKLTKMRENAQRKIQQVEEQKLEVEKDRDAKKSKISHLERDLDDAKKKAEQDKKKHDDLVRDRDILSKTLLKATNATEKQASLVKLHESGKKSLEQDIQAYREEGAKQRKIIYQLEKERDKYINEASDLTQKVLQHMEEVKVREMTLFDYKKKIAEAETKLKQQQNLYEACRSDRNLYSKNLVEAQDEIEEMKRKLRIMTHQIDQLKDEIASRNTENKKQEEKLARTEKEKDQLKDKYQKAQNMKESTQNQLEQMNKEVKNLNDLIRDADEERKRQQKELQQVVSERDILGTQLVRRNDELALLYEKIKIQQSTLAKGEIQYRQRLQDIRLLKLEIKKLRREKAILNKNVSSIDDLRKEVYHTQRELLRERTRCKALEEELENPMNIHRWRKLEASDPNRYEMILKIQALQKRLIDKTEEVVEKELAIQEKEKLYVELKQILARQPGPEVAEQLSLYQNALRDKTKQMKRLASELNMFESQSTEYKYEIERLATELQETKKNWFQMKKKDQQRKEKERLHSNTHNMIHTKRVDGPRFTGGGFNLNQAASSQPGATAAGGNVVTAKVN